VPDLLIHSMSEFADIIFDAIGIAGARDIVEIGAEYGGMSKLLADHAARVGGSLTSIDPAAKSEFTDWIASQPELLRHIAEPSLKALSQVGPTDAWLIDGDHNWFTVYHELHAIDRNCRDHGKPMLAFLHDIGWPSGRRDMYYAPEQIPAGRRHPYSYDGGALPGFAGLVGQGGFRGNGHFAWAAHEGGPRNGVLTAVEDFLADLHAQGRTMAFAEIPAVFGLGVLFSEEAPWSEALGAQILPYHQHPLLASLEANRLANYLRVIELQEIAFRAAA
jgi:hypothetical protein